METATSRPPRRAPDRGRSADPRQRFDEAGGREFLAGIVRERLGKRRFYALAAAIREHEAHARAGVEPSKRDLALWSKLEEIERSIPVREQG
jgi:hypothetical protein